jgi:hypothetical protein
MMTEEEFAEELADLMLRFTPCLPAKALLAILNDECEALRGEIIKAQVEAGTWPPD